MKKLMALMVLSLLKFNLSSKVCETVVDGKKLEKETMETHDYLPAIHGTIRAKYEY